VGAVCIDKGPISLNDCSTIAIVGVGILTVLSAVFVKGSVIVLVGLGNFGLGNFDFGVLKTFGVIFEGSGLKYITTSFGFTSRKKLTGGKLTGGFSPKN